MGYSPWGHKEPDMTEWLTLFIYMCYLICHHNIVILSTYSPAKESGEGEILMLLLSLDFGFPDSWLSFHLSSACCIAL